MSTNKKQRNGKMKVVIAIDSFKGSISSFEAGKCVAEGITNVIPECETIIKPLADGGEGTVEALTEGLTGRKKKIIVSGPLCERVEAEYGIVDRNKTAIIEMASAAGITLISGEQRNPYYTTTYGVGEMIKDAISEGCRNFIIGIGGSATNDGGVGMLQALGFRFYKNNGKTIEKGAYGLKDLAHIENDKIISQLRECRFRIACDVKNVLCGADGCSAIYGPQKGATDEMVVEMDGWMKHYASIVRKYYPDANENVPGAGAAGGLGYAFKTFLNADLTSGIDIIMNEINLEKDLADADFVITGEGRLDRQTVMGKAPVGVAKLAKKYQIPVIAFAGSVTKDADICNKNGIDAFFPIVRGVCTLDAALNSVEAKNNLKQTVEQVFRLIAALH